MEDEELNVNDTVDDNSEARDTARTAGRGIKNVGKGVRKAFNAVRTAISGTIKAAIGGVLSALIPIIVIIVLLIGMLSFLISMPGLVTAKIEEFKKGVLSLILGDDNELSQIAKDETRQAQKDMLKYLDEMGIDPVSFGFAPFYELTEDGEVKYDLKPNKNSNLYRMLLNLNDGNDEAAERAYYNLAGKDKDLILKYIISSSRTYYLRNDEHWIGEIVSKLDGTISGNMHGMLVTKGISGLDDSSIKIDRENKQLVINSVNSSEWSTQKFLYNLEDWTARYGTPFEFLMALHLGTMTSDLTNEMIDAPELQTEVLIDLTKDDYDLDFDITYWGRILPIKFGDPTKDLHKLDNLTKYIKIDDEGNASLDVPRSKLETFKKKATISSLYGLMQHLNDTNIKRNEEWNDGTNISTIENEAKEALLSDQDFRVINKITDTYEDSNDFAIWTAFYGIANSEENGKYSKELGEDGNSLISGAVETDDTSEIWNNKHTEMLAYRYSRENNGVYTSQSFYDVYAALKENYSQEELKDIQKAIDAETDSESYTASISHGLYYYLDSDANTLELKKEQNYIALTAMLTQLDSYIYMKSVTEGSSLNQQFVACKNPEKINDFSWSDNYGEYEIKFVQEGKMKMSLSQTHTSASTYLLLTKDWLDFYYGTGEYEGKGGLQNRSADEIQAYLDSLIEKINKYWGYSEQYDEDSEDQQSIKNKIVGELLANLGMEDWNVEDIKTIYDTLKNETDEVEYATPRISHVIKHWYKDIVFEYDNNGGSIAIPLKTETPGLNVTALLKNGARYTQSKQPYVIKGDIVTVDGEVVDDAKYDGSTVVKDFNGDDYTLGDGNRLTKRLFTQGRYYTLDGTRETAISIWYAKELEELGKFINAAPYYAMVSVKQGRIVDYANLSTKAPSDLSNKVAEGDGWEVYLASSNIDENEIKENIYYVKATRNIEYKSPADYDKNSYNYADSVATADNINKLLTAMDVETLREPLSFDNTSASADTMTLNAFAMLEGMHTESAELIYRDFKEFLIELGYYTKAEFDYLDTNVLSWFIPGYMPESMYDEDSENAKDNIRHWAQNKGEDIDKYAAVLYPEETDAEGNVTQEGFQSGLDVVTPGNCKVISIAMDKITLEFDGESQPEISLLDGYTMTISGIDLAETIAVLDDDGETEIEKTLTVSDDVIKAGTIIGQTKSEKIQVLLKNAQGGIISNIEDYMGPQLETQNSQVTDLAYFYFVPYEGGRAGMVSNASGKREVAVGISQWTTISDGANSFNNISYACKYFYENNPTLCAELQTFINWTPEQIWADYSSGNSQLVAAFQTVEDRDRIAFTELQEQLTIEEKTRTMNDLGIGWMAERNPVAVGTLWSLINWGPYMGWENHVSESMTDEQIIVSLLKYACTQTSTAGSLNSRWESQARLALDILHGDFTDIEGWISNKGGYPEYGEGNNTGYLSNK